MSPERIIQTICWLCLAALLLKNLGIWGGKVTAESIRQDALEQLTNDDTGNTQPDSTESE